MNFFKCLILFFVVGVLWSTSSLIKSNRLNQLVADGAIPYGPIPSFVDNFYSYDGFTRSFNSGLNLKRANEFTKVEFENLILDSLDPAEKQNFKQYLPQTLELSVDYQVDPFWIISVMMVESAFDFKAKSNKNAKGLMQVRPETASQIYLLMRKKMSSDRVHKNLHLPKENIEVGIFYLKKLLQNFRMNYGLATIAYNVGPNRLKNILNLKKFSTFNYSYLAKVQISYKILSKNFALELKKRLPPFEMTYVVLNQGQKFEESLLRSYFAVPSSLESNLVLGSENLNHLSLNTLSF